MSAVCFKIESLTSPESLTGRKAEFSAPRGEVNKNDYPDRRAKPVGKCAAFGYHFLPCNPAIRNGSFGFEWIGLPHPKLGSPLGRKNMATKTDVKLSTLSYVIVYVQDVVKAIPFYRDKLGLTVKTQEEGWVELETGSVTLALHALEKGKKHPGKLENGPIIVFNVDNIYETVDSLKSRGVTIEGKPEVACDAGDHEGLCVSFYDPEGNHFSVFAMHPKK